VYETSMRRLRRISVSGDRGPSPRRGVRGCAITNGLLSLYHCRARKKRRGTRATCYDTGFVL